jgi:hypothetical protein
MTTEHEHSFPVQPPHFITRPGPCQVCGKTWLRAQAERLAREAQDVFALLDEKEGPAMPGD